MSKAPIKDYAREFKKTIEGLCHNRGIREIFIDWLDIAACALHQEPYHVGLVPIDKDFDKVEAQYLAAVKKYTREELDAFAKLLGITKMALWEGKTDFLGQLYMELEISNDRSGEFFTPFPLSLMMAQMTFGDISKRIEEKGFITVGEPACGGGGMLIAAAQVIEDQGFDASKVMFFEATDISKPCCDMAYIQTSVLGLSGIVRHGNTLSMQQWSHRFTPICRVFPARTNIFIKSLFPTQTTENVTATDKPTPAPPPAPVQAQDQVQQTSLLALLEETLNQTAPSTLEQPTQQKKQPKPAAKLPATDQLAQETDDYIQGRLF